jgi:putative flavoprotein involved in K+ transport
MFKPKESHHLETIKHTIVIGAGQAGLAAGYYLKKAERDFLILDTNARVGDGWRQRWEGLRLFSPQRYNHLPGLAPKGGDWHLPDRLEMADYLETYATHFALPVQTHCTCVRASCGPKGEIVKQSGNRLPRVWTVETTKGTFLTHNLVVATGAYRSPWKPAAVADTFPAEVTQYHSSAITDVAKIADPNTDVLVVGAGASGQQLSHLLLATGATVTLAGPPVANLPRSFLGKDIYWWLYKSGIMTMRTDRFPGKLILDENAGDVTVGEPELPAAIRRVKTEIVRYHEGSLRCKCQKTAPEPIAWPAAGKKGVVVWCTGYRNAYPWLPEEMLDDNSAPEIVAGRSPLYPEVVFLGLPNLRRPNSSLVGGVGEDARSLVGRDAT